MRKVFKQIIPLYVLLVLSSGTLFAHITLPPLSSTKAELQDAFSKIDEIQVAIQHFSKNSINESFEKNLIFNEKEKDEEDVIAAVPQKNLAKTSCFQSYFNQKKTRDYFYYFSNSLYFYEDFFHLTSYSSLYIIFKVFRI